MHNLKINYIGKTLSAQGPGTRYTIWTQGCSIHCPGCSNTNTWDFNGGRIYTVNELTQDILNTKNIDGITITGGEPLDQFESVYNLCKNLFGKICIFLTTGYDCVSLEKLKIITVVDILCVGPFKISYPCSSGWKGSSNQTIHFMTPLGKKQENMPNIPKEIIIKTNGDTIITGFHI
jgi:anaerobic ribonucleoside-triphosphate reductase activating protein